jgi:hypothetical protein
MDRIVRLLWPKYLRLRLDVNALQAQMGRVMAKQEDFDARMGLMDAATNEIASDLQALRDELKAGGAVSDANLATLDAKIARLQVLGADPIDPVPTE